jgi:hypothetical protein
MESRVYGGLVGLFACNAADLTLFSAALLLVAQTAAEVQKRRENFVNELDVVISDVVLMLLLFATEFRQYLHT